MEDPHPKTPTMEEIDLSAHDGSDKEEEDQPAQEKTDSPPPNPRTPEEDSIKEGAGIDPDDEDDSIFQATTATIKKAVAARKREEKKQKDKEAKEQSGKGSAAAKPQAKKPRSEGPAWMEEIETAVVELLARR